MNIKWVRSGIGLLLFVGGFLFLLFGRSALSEAGNKNNLPEKRHSLNYTLSNDGQTGQVIVSEPVIPVVVGPVRDLPPYVLQPGPVREINPRYPPDSGQETEDYNFPGGPDPLLALQEAAPAAIPDGFDTPIFNFDGAGFQNLNPPDTNGAVGKDHYIQLVNATIVSIYNKYTGALIQRFDTLALGGCATSTGDPIVLYDHLADRWMLTEFGTGNSLCVLISETADPTGSYFSYRFPTPNFPDYPKYGVWPDGYYVSTNEFNVGQSGAYALDRTSMLTGAPATSQRFSVTGLPGFPANALTPSDWDGATPPPTGAPNYFMRHRDTEAHGPGGFPAEDFLQIWAFHVDWVTPANSTFTQLPDISVAEFDSSLCSPGSRYAIAMPGVAKCIMNVSLSPLGEFILFKMQYRNFGSHETLVGNLTTDATGADDAGVRWFELRKVGAGNWSLFQEGTYAPDSDSRWMGAVAMDGAGNMALGYNVSSGTTFPSLRYVGRLASDPLGTMPQGEYNIIAGSASNASYRYGDYSGISVDPIDDCTFWFTGEYNPAPQWSTRIAAFRFDGCGTLDFTMSTTPISQDICFPNDAIYTVVASPIIGFSGDVSLAALGNPGSALFNPNPITPYGSSSLTISGAPIGSYSYDVVGTSVLTPALVHTNTVTLTVSTVVVPPTLVSPPDGDTSVSIPAPLSWNAVAEAISYTVEVATDMAFSNIVYSNILTGTNDMATGLNLDTQYYWRVRSNNACGSGVNSAVWSFITDKTEIYMPGVFKPPAAPAHSSLTIGYFLLPSLVGLGFWPVWRRKKSA